MLGSFENAVLDWFVDAEDMNPFSKKKILKYVVPESSYVMIVICDINGNEVMKVLNEYMIQGSYTCTIDVSALATGVYDCIIKSGQNSYKAPLYIVT